MIAAPAMLGALALGFISAGNFASPASVTGGGAIEQGVGVSYYTGSPRAKWDCAVCHIGERIPLLTVSEATGELFARGYQPGSAYDLTVKMPMAGLSNSLVVEILGAGDLPVGTLAESTLTAPCTLATVDNNNVAYVTCAGGEDETAWTFRWTAPAQDAGPATLYVGAVAASVGEEPVGGGQVTGDRPGALAVAFGAPRGALDQAQGGCGQSIGALALLGVLLAWLARRRLAGRLLALALIIGTPTTTLAAGTPVVALEFKGPNAERIRGDVLEVLGGMSDLELIPLAALRDQGAAGTLASIRGAARKRGAKAMIEGWVNRVGGRLVLTLAVLPTAGGDRRMAVRITMRSTRLSAREQGDIETGVRRALRSAMKATPTPSEAAMSDELPPPPREPTVAAVPKMRKPQAKIPDEEEAEAPISSERAEEEDDDPAAPAAATAAAKAGGARPGAVAQVGFGMATRDAKVESLSLAIPSRFEASIYPEVVLAIIIFPTILAQSKTLNQLFVDLRYARGWVSAKIRASDRGIDEVSGYPHRLSAAFGWRQELGPLSISPGVTAYENSGGLERNAIVTDPNFTMVGGRLPIGIVAGRFDIDVQAEVGSVLDSGPGAKAYGTLVEGDYFGVTAGFSYALGRPRIFFGRAGFSVAARYGFTQTNAQFKGPGDRNLVSPKYGESLHHFSLALAHDL
jgi:hypothetical protein